MDNISISHKLFNSCMKGNWNDVVRLYRENPTAHKAKINRAGDTALHVAVSDIQEDIVAELITQISEQSNPKGTLEFRNERGDTALHIAASLGSARMCSFISQVDRSLIGARNLDNETPLFVAALHGKKDAFLCLDSFVERALGYSFSRRKDGQTTLHCAISGDHFDLAFQIIHLYGKLANSVDENGFTPLHLLASKPTAFKSSSHFGWFQWIIYHCISVDDLKVNPSFDHLSSPVLTRKMHTPNYPENYQACNHTFQLLQNFVQIATGISQKQSRERDAENLEAANGRVQGNKLFPPNYRACFDFLQLVSKVMIVVIGLGSARVAKLKEKKKKHVWSVQIMEELLRRSSLYKDIFGDLYDRYETKPYAIVDGGDVTSVTEELRENHYPLQVEQIRSPTVTTGLAKTVSAVLIAARSGITEIVEKILEDFPVAIHDMNSEKKNLVLLAVENRQPHVYQLLLRRNIMKETIFRAVDENGNSALHLAAMLGDHKPWLIPGAALQMQWEIKWFEFVKNSMPLHFFARYNKQGKTPRNIFTETHKELVERGEQWLTNTSRSCSVVAALIATVAFATSTTVPGGTNQESGKPNLEFHPAFDVFAISSLIALCFSVTAVVMFLAILTSRYQEKDFGKDLPTKLLFGMTSLFVSIAAMLVSFCAGYFFVLKDRLKYAAYPVYAVTCLPVTLFAVAQFPLYFDLAWATFKKVPQRSYAEAVSLESGKNLK